MGLNWTEEQLRQAVSNNPALKVHEQGKAKKKKPAATKRAESFESKAEERYYYKYIQPLELAGSIVSCEMHKTFEIVPAFTFGKKKYKNREYTPDFFLKYRDGSTEVVEVKGRQIKKLQRDYPLRRQLFLYNYCIPNNWRFIEIFDDEV